MGHGPEEYVFSEEMVAVESNTTDVVNFRYGSLELARRLDAVRSGPAEVYVEYFVLPDDQIEPRASGPTLTFYLHRGGRESGEVWFERPLPFGRRALFSLRELDSGRPTILVNETYKMWSRLRITQSSPPGQLLTDVVTLKLIEAGVLPLHGGAVAADGRALVIMGPPDIGKTFTTMTLVREGFTFLSEDLCIASDRHIHGVPYTQTLAKRDPDLNWLQRARDCIVGSLWKGNPRKASIFEEFKLAVSRVAGKAEGAVLYLLDRGEPEVERLTAEAAFRELRGINGLEFAYARNPTLLWYLYLNGTRSVYDVMQRENRLLGSFVSRIPVFKVYAPSASEYAELVREHFGGL